MTLADELPFHPRTGLQAIGLLRNGNPIWPVLGGAEDDDDAATEDDAKADEGQEGDSDGGDSVDSDDDAKDDKPDDEDKPLGPAGEKAYLAEKEKRKQAAERARAEKARADAAEAELAKLRRTAERAKAKAAKPEEKPADDEPDVDPEEVQREAEAKATAKANERIVKAEVRASAAGKLSDPLDALKFLDLSKFEVDADGNVDTEEIDDAIVDLLEKKPYLAVPAQGERKRFKGSGDGGAKPNKPARPKSLGEAITRHYTK
jgi:hypothetical protein